VKVAVRLFASLRDLAGGADRVELELAEGATSEDAWRSLVGLHSALAPRRTSLTAAVNRRYARFDEPLHAGDEVAFIPPVSGG
jgi:molybdopterin converting factor subunit 1